MKTRFARTAAVLLAAILLSGCGARSSGGTASYEMASQAITEDSVNAGGAESALLPEDSTATAESAQKIIYRADMQLESTDFDTARDTLLTAVTDCSGWLESSSLYGTAQDQDRTAHYTVRVPVDRYRDFLSLAGQVGSVQNLNEYAENVTNQYIDVNARITSLENQRDRLNALADQAETTSDLLEIESQLSDVQYQLESYTQQMRALEGDITYSTVDVTLEEVATLTPTGTTFGARLTGAFTGGWNGFVAFVQGLILALVYLWPALLVVVLAVVVIRLLARRHRARHPRPPKGTPPVPPAQYTVPSSETSQPEDSKPKYKN